MVTVGNALALACLTCFLPFGIAALSAEPSWKKDASIIYSGVCDGSAGVQIDQTTLLVANDETNVLYSYDTLGGAPVASIDLGEKLILHRKKPEIDFEAVARSGDSLWWIGSHGRNKNGKKRPNRRMLFSTNVPARDLSNIRVTSRQFNLIPALQAQPELANILTDEVLKTPPKEGGLNIEGMSFAPDGRLMIGLRSPLAGAEGVKGAALIVYLIQDDDRWSVSSFISIDLKDRGVRDMVWTDGTLMLIAGSVHSGGRFDIYSWSGNTGEKPQIKASDIQDLNAEALVLIGSKWLVLSDDGTKKRISANGLKEECKDLAEVEDMANVYFRARVLSYR